MDNPQLRGKNNLTTDGLQISKRLDPISPLKGASRGSSRVSKGKGKEKAPEAQRGGQISEVPSTSCMQPEEGVLQQSIVAVRTESLAGEAAKGEVEVPGQKESTKNLEGVDAMEVTEVPVEKESLRAEHRQYATPPDSEEEEQSEGGAMDLIMDDFDRPVVSPKDPPDKKTSSSKKKKKR
ncbi:hypothetical protein U1Q18_020058 [Sarracenia purpurea var. burkii]